MNRIQFTILSSLCAIASLSAFSLVANGRTAPDEELAKGTPPSQEQIFSAAVDLKEGHGLQLHPKIKDAIALKVAEVVENRIAPEFNTQLLVRNSSSGGGATASGWLSANQAGDAKVGQKVELWDSLGGPRLQGEISGVEASPFPALGDFEILVNLPQGGTDGARLNALIRGAEKTDVTTVPRSALLKTAEGWFVYTVNEEFYLRTPVQVGAMTDDVAEVTEGLYAGDQIVTSPVETLWMAELQILRGGKSCTCGH
jgi:hypothetical protein